MPEPESLQIEASVGSKPKKPKKKGCFSVTIIPGHYDEEVSWHVKDKDGLQICSNLDTTTACCAPSGKLKEKYFAHCYDSYGDGWDGYRIMFDNKEVCSGFTNGRYRKDEIIAKHRGNLDDYVCFRVEFTAGSWDSEVRWHVDSFSSDTEVCSKGDTECCGEKGTFAVICEDTYGDGWNGYQLYFDGKEVCEGFSTGSYKESIITKTKVAKSSVEMSVGAIDDMVKESSSNFDAKILWIGLVFLFVAAIGMKIHKSKKRGHNEYSYLIENEL